MKLHSLQDENVFESRKAFCPPGGVRTESSSPPRAATTLLSLPTTLQLECRGVTPEKNASLTNYASLGIPWYANTLPLLPPYAFRRIAHYSTPCYFAIRSSHLRDASSLPVVQSHDLQKLESLPSIAIAKNSKLTPVFFLILPRVRRFGASQETGMPAPPVERIPSSSPHPLFLKSFL